MTLAEVLQIIIIFLPAIILNECAHGWVADKLGDPTAKLAGRLTLNPIKHIDPVGTFLLPMVLLLAQSPVLFGWAKPVPVNFSNLRNPKRDMMWVGLAGPAINVIIAVFLSILLHLNLPPAGYEFITAGIIVNLVLATFNMIPVPPLDGSRLVMSLLPRRWAVYYSRLENFGILIVFILLYLKLLDKIVWPVVVYLAQLLGAQVTL